MYKAVHRSLPVKTKAEASATNFALKVLFKQGGLEKYNNLYLLGHNKQLFWVIVSNYSLKFCP